MTDCIAKQFGCSCVGECRTASRRKEEIQKLNRIIAKRNADTALMMVSVAVCFSLVALCFIHFAVPESQRLARANQENITWNR